MGHPVRLLFGDTSGLITAKADATDSVVVFSNFYSGASYISYDANGNVARLTQRSPQQVWVDITAVQYDNHPTPYAQASQSLFFVSLMTNPEANLRYVMMLSKNNPTDVYIKA